MAIPKSVNLRNDGDIDILDMYTELNDNHVSIAICPDDYNIVSVLCDNKTDFMHLLLNKKETELIIDALSGLYKRIK